MFRIKYTCAALVATLLALVVSSEARAQYNQPYTPFQGFGDMVQMNLNFDRNFEQYNRAGSMWVAQQTRGQQLPFNAMTIHQSNNAANQAFSGYMNSLQQNSNRQMNAVENWTNQALRGYSPYVNSNGQGYMLPYGPNAYHQTQGGYIRPGTNYNYQGSNFYVR